MRAVVSLGSNIEPRDEYLRRAIEELSALPGTMLVRQSSVRETEPVDVPEEYARFKFLNQAAIFESSLDYREFSRLMHLIEDKLGRVRTIKNGPRTIDIDLILYGDVKSDNPEIILPHPRAKEREFVTTALRELDVVI